MIPMTLDRQKKIVALAQSLIGKPYRYGAMPEDAPALFDCSSFTQYCMRQVGIDIPRSTILQAEDVRGAPVSLGENFSNLEPGDLLFFHGTRGHYSPAFPEGIGHVAIYIDGGIIIHAGSRRTSEYPEITEVGVVEEQELSDTLKKLEPLVVIKRF